MLAGQKKARDQEKKTGVKQEELTSQLDRERFRLMGKSYFEDKGSFMKPIFRECVTLACQRTLHVREMLRYE